MKRILGAAALLAAAGILLAQQKTVLGTVTKFKVDSLELGIQSDSGEPVLLKVGPETLVVQIPPGERDLRQAKGGQGHRHHARRPHHGLLCRRPQRRAPHRPDRSR